MDLVREVTVPARDLARFEPILGQPAIEQARAVAVELLRQLDGAAIWNLNSTPVGGGVAEMLQPLLGLARGVGVDVRWLVIGGSPDFFRLTKRLHHALHGSPGSGDPLDEDAHRLYEETLRANVEEVAGRVRVGDVVILHDPQTAGMAPALIASGARVIWRSHIGSDGWDDEVERGWSFLRPYLEEVPRFVFSRAAYVPPFLGRQRVTIIPPSIDALSAKNEDLDDETVRSILSHVGLIEGPPPEHASYTFVRGDGSVGRVERRADIVRLGPAPAWERPLVVQVSRWDPLKDMIGVLQGFARVGLEALHGAELVLAGPNVHGVADDPEGPAVFAEVLEAWRALPHGTRQRVHLASLPTADIEENAAIVNALQRHAAIVVQKSLKEGFGLTVTEAMWKARPVVASAVGGIQDQIIDGECGLLLSDPTDLDAFAAALARLLADPEAAARMGRAARDRVRGQFLGVRHLLQYGALIGSMTAG
jgi:trehalose synthase